MAEKVLFNIPVSALIGAAQDMSVKKKQAASQAPKQKTNPLQQQRKQTLNEERQERYNTRFRDEAEQTNPVEDAKKWRDEAARLEQEKAANTELYVDGIYMGTDREAAQSYDERIKEARDKATAAENTAKEQGYKRGSNGEMVQQKTDAQRDRHLQEYLDAAKEFEETAHYATDETTSGDIEALRRRMEEAEALLKEDDKRLGNGVVSGR